MNLLDSALVEANRRGEFTAEQVAWQRAKPRRPRSALMRAGWGFVLGLAAGLLMIVAFSSRVDPSALVGIAFAMAFVGMLCMVFVPIVRRRLRGPTNFDENSMVGLIRNSVGELEFHEGEYRALTGERTLLLPPSANACGLVPGMSYNFYYLEASGIVLSAEQLGRAGSEVAPSLDDRVEAGVEVEVLHALGEILADANRYSMEELDANRRGELTTSQKLRLLKGSLAEGLGWLLGAALAGAVLFSAVNGVGPVGILALLWIPCSVPILFLLIIAGETLSNGFRDIFPGLVETVQGVGAKGVHSASYRSGSPRDACLYEIGGQSFRVPKRAHSALIDGLEYRAFCAARTRRLLSIEPVGEPGISS